MRRSFSTLLLALVVIWRTADADPGTRSSCRGHFLAGQRETGVYSLGNDGSTASRLVCEMPSSFEDFETTVTTVIGNALEVPSTIKKKSSSNFQAVDLYWLKEVIRTSACKQTVTVEWPSVPVESLTFGISLISLLNTTTHLTPKEYPQTVELAGTAAGIRHLLPDVEGSDRSPIVTASSVRCTQPIVEKASCLTESKMDIRIPSQPWKYEFAFRTDRSDQALVSFLNGEEEASHVRMENDFFLRVDGNPSVTIGQLSDAEWHTVLVTVENHQVRLKVDDKSLIVKHMTLLNTRLTTLQIKLEGELLLFQGDCPVKEDEDVELSGLCSGCDCTVLNQHFDGLPSSSCEPDEDDSFQLLRDPDRLSFIHIPDAFAVDTEDGLDIRVATGFKSDSDAGLLLFGYWHGMPGKGRWQVHYAGNVASALLCRTYSGEETCIACEVKEKTGLGKDRWHRAVFFGSGDSFTFGMDRKACRLSAITPHNNVSTAEVYAIPAITQGVGLFVGGTYFEKKKSSLYKNEFTQRYFENTREKMTTLRGCIKDVFTHGKKTDLATVYRNQMSALLTRPEDMSSFAIQIGCPSCSSPCPQGIRCRTPPPIKGSAAKCDCADLELIEGEDGTCPARDTGPVPLSTRFVSMNPIVLPLETTKALLSRLWLKIRLPKNPRGDMVVAEFNSHRETMFRIIVSPGGLLSLEAHPNDGGGFSATITHQLNPDDNRAHLVSITRRTPVGTRHTARKYELRIDGERYELPDTGKNLLNNVSFTLADGLDEEHSVVVHDIGIGYDLDEHVYIWHPTNTIHQIDLHSRLYAYLYRNPDPAKVGELDPYLWDGAVSPKGAVVDYSPDKFDPELLLSSRWFIYSIILVLLILLLVLICLCCCCCMRRRGRRTTSNASDREQMMRDSPDYGPVKMRRNSSFSMHDDNSIGTDDTDLNAYRDIPSHRVKIYRESMVSILVPSVDNPSEAAIVKRLSVEEPIRSPPPGSPAPLVSVTEEEQ